MKFVNILLFSVFCFRLLRGLLKKKFVFFCLLLSAFCLNLSAQENPFIEMADNPYSQYFEYLEGKVYRNIEQRDSMWAKHIVAQMREAAKLSKNKKWRLEADFCEAMFRFRRGQIMLHKPNQKQMDSLGAIFTGSLLSIVQQAKKMKAFDVELRAMYRIWDFYGYHLKNYEMAFRYGLEFDKSLSKVSADEFPLRPHHYSEIGKLYYSFQEYETANIYFEKGLEGVATHNPLMTNQAVIKTLWNNRGLIYRNHYNDLDKSDSCFRQITEMKLQYPNQLFGYDSIYIQHEYQLWAGIAKGNLGTNCYLRGDYQQAIPLLKYGIEKAVGNKNQHNFPYAIGKAILLAEIFIELSDLPQAQLYLDKAADFFDRLQQRSSVSDVKTNIELWVDYYKTMNRYCRMTGNNEQALLYADSTAAMQTQLEDEFNLRKLRRVEQQVNQEKLDSETFRSKTYFRGLIIISVFSLLLIMLFILLYRSYRKKQDAYRELVLKSQQWAKVYPAAIQSDTNELTEQEQKKQNIHPDATDLSLMEELERLMTEEKLYKNHSLTLDFVANRLGYKPYLVSGVVNRCTKKDFSTFVGEYRIKEAIRLLSEKNAHRFSLDSIAFDSGFNDRRNFNRVFKKMTGVTPTEFLKLR